LRCVHLAQSCQTHRHSSETHWVWTGTVLALFRGIGGVMIRGILSFLFIAFIGAACSNPTLVVQDRLIIESSLESELLPVLATRQPACISCHAKIHGDFITDVGYDSPFFMGSDSPANHPGDTHYGPLQSKHFIHSTNTWRTASFMGDIYVPRVEVRIPDLIAAYNHPNTGNEPINSILLEDLLLSNLFVDPNKDGQGSVVPIVQRTTNADPDTPGLRGRIKSKDYIYIGAPTENEIRSLSQSSSSRLILNDVGLVVHKGDDGDFMSGLIARKNSKNRKIFLTHEEVLTCRGDLIVDGVLFLHNLKLDTDNAGCRIYSTGSVFIQGPITYVNQDKQPYSNLQISSARAIVMGFASMGSRFGNDATGFITNGIREAITDTQEEIFNQKIISDRDRVEGLTDDAGPFKVVFGLVPGSTAATSVGDLLGYTTNMDRYEWEGYMGRSVPDLSTCRVGGLGSAKAFYDQGYKCIIDHARDNLKKSIDFNHLLLNAPKVHSRYHGKMQGVVIGEDVLFAVGNFEFHADPVLSKVPLLPLLGDSIFFMTEE
jgi:hypothetical protein